MGLTCIRVLETDEIYRRHTDVLSFLKVAVIYGTKEGSENMMAQNLKEISFAGSYIPKSKSCLTLNSCDS